MSDAEGNSQFCFPQSPDVSLDELINTFWVNFLNFDSTSLADNRELTELRCILRTIKIMKQTSNEHKNTTELGQKMNKTEEDFNELHALFKLFSF